MGSTNVTVYKNRLARLPIYYLCERRDTVEYHGNLLNSACVTYRVQLLSDHQITNKARQQDPVLLAYGIRSRDGQVVDSEYFSAT